MVLNNKWQTMIRVIHYHRTTQIVSLFIVLLCPPIVSAKTTLFHHFTGYSVNANTVQRFDALLVRDGKVLKIGDDATLTHHAVDARVDLQGQVLLPGLIDAHGHVMSLGEERQQVDLRDTRSVQEALQRLADFAKANPHAKWITGRGWNQVLWPGKQFPTAQDIDRVLGKKPVYLERIDGHAAWVNSAALAAANIGAHTLSPAGGDILRLPNTQASGILIDKAMELVARVIPSSTAQKKQDAIVLALRELQQLGITGVHDAGISLDDFQLYENLAQKNELKIRVYAMLNADTPHIETLLARGVRTHMYGDKLDLRAIKIVGDGALGSRGALLLDDYSDKPKHRGLAVMDSERIKTITYTAAKHGWQVNIHAIGDAANRDVLNIFSQLPAPLSAHTLRHRIEHAQIISLADISRFSQSGVIASMQPTHATSDKNMAEDRIGPERIKGAYAWRKLLDSGARLAAGSDFPVELPNPFLGLHAAVTRQDRQNQPTGGWYAEEKLSRAEALRSFTFDAAYAGFSENQTGSLDAGKWADFIVIDRDYFTIPERDIADINVLQTYVAGERIFHRAGKY